MSDWYTVESLKTMGNSWNVSGIGTVNVSGLTSFTQTVTLQDTASAKFWFPGNGTESYLVASASITQGSLSTPVKVNGKTSFYVPKEGRWSDWVSIADFALPGDVTFSFSIASLSAKIPAASTAPTTPVGVSAVFYPISSTPVYSGGLPLIDNFENVDGWETKSGQQIVFGSAGSYRYIRKDSTAAFSVMPTIFTVKLDTTFSNLGTRGTSSVDMIVLMMVWEYNYINFGFYSDGLYDLLTNTKICDISVAAAMDLSFVIDATNPAAANMKIYLAGALYVETTLTLNTYPVSLGYTYIVLSGHTDSTEELATLRNFSIYYGSYVNSAVAIVNEVTSTCTITVTENPAPGDTLTINNSATTVFTFVDHYPNNSGEIQIGTTTAITAANIATAISNITGAEFAATTVNNIITIVAHVSTPFSVTTTSAGLTIGTITEIIPGYNAEEATVTDVFTATEGGKSVQENATVADSADGLIDGLTENSSVATSIDCLIGDMDEGVGVTTTSDNFDGLIEYMGEVVLE